MKRMFTAWLAATALMIFSALSHAQAPLTDERVDKLIQAMGDLQPMMQEVGQRLAKLPAEERPPRIDPKSEGFNPEKMADGMADALKKVDAYPDVKRVASDHGFDSAEELLEVQARVMMGLMAATQQAMMNNPNVPEKVRNQMQQRFGNVAEKVSDNDREVLQRNRKKLMEIMRANQQRRNAAPAQSGQ